jgi:hypothetical protein
MLAGPHNSHTPYLLSTSLFFTKHHDFTLSRSPQRNGLILFRRTLVTARLGDPSYQCQQ